jgi:hypothetical protein
MRIPKTIAILLGLTLGWWAAGFVQTGVSTAQEHPAEEVHRTDPLDSHDEGAEEHAPGAGQEHAEETAHTEGEGASHGDAHGGSHGEVNPNIRALAPAEEPGYFTTMTTLVIVLFVLAALVGSAALVMKGPEPPDPADEHH